MRLEAVGLIPNVPTLVSVLQRAAVGYNNAPEHATMELSVIPVAPLIKRSIFATVTTAFVRTTLTVTIMVRAVPLAAMG